MATKKNSTPAVRYLRYELTNSATPGTETSHYIDLAKDLSAVNRRLYRQGRKYHVKRISIVSSNTIAQGQPAVSAGRITVGCVPDSWSAANAWKRGFGLFQEMNKRGTAGVSGNIAGTWQDFKVWLSYEHRQGTKLTPKDNGGNDVAAGEWVHSRMISPDGTTSADEFEVHMLGAHQGSAGAWVSVGLIESYGESRATVVEGLPALGGDPSSDPLVNLFDDGTVNDEIVNRLESDNDLPPYERDQYPGGADNMPKPLVVQQTTLGADGRATVGGFSAMCGLLEIEATSPIASDVYSVLVELAPGSYRGIAAEVI
jgi:hypothetical protein